MSDKDLPYRPCVGIMLWNAAGLVWQGRRCAADGDPEGPGAWWQMPQGGIEAGEDIEQAALRELREETGLHRVEILAVAKDWHYYDLPPAFLPETWARPYRGQKQKWVAMRFLGNDDEVSIAAAGGHGEIAEFDAWRWAEMSQLVAEVVSFKRPVYEAVIAEFSQLK